MYILHLSSVEMDELGCSKSDRSPLQNLNVLEHWQSKIAREDHDDPKGLGGKPVHVMNSPLRKPSEVDVHGR